MHLRLHLLILSSLGLCALVSAHQSHHAHPEPLTLLNSFPKCAVSSKFLVRYILRLANFSSNHAFWERSLEASALMMITIVSAIMKNS
jgi:hypothetical protein